MPHLGVGHRGAGFDELQSPGSIIFKVCVQALPFTTSVKVTIKDAPPPAVPGPSVMVFGAPYIPVIGVTLVP